MHRIISISTHCPMRDITPKILNEDRKFSSVYRIPNQQNLHAKPVSVSYQTNGSHVTFIAGWSGPGRTKRSGKVASEHCVDLIWYPWYENVIVRCLLMVIESSLKCKGYGYNCLSRTSTSTSRGAVSKHVWCTSATLDVIFICVHVAQLWSLLMWQLSQFRIANLVSFEFIFRDCAETTGMKISYYKIVESMRFPHKYNIMNDVRKSGLGVGNGAYTLSNNSPNN